MLYENAKGYEFAIEESKIDDFIVILNKFKEKINTVGINNLNLLEIETDNNGIVKEKRTHFLKVDCDSDTEKEIRKELNKLLGEKNE